MGRVRKGEGEKERGLETWVRHVGGVAKVFFFWEELQSVAGQKKRNGTKKTQTGQNQQPAVDTRKTHKGQKKQHWDKIQKGIRDKKNTGDKTKNDSLCVLFVFFLNVVSLYVSFLFSFCFFFFGLQLLHNFS